MKISLFVSLLLFSIVGAAHNRTVKQSFFAQFPEAVSDGLLIDTPLDALLYSLGILENPLFILPRTVAAVGGYAIRKTCNDYQTAEDGSKDWKISTFCGFAGGASKYSFRTLATGKFNYLEPVIGALDAGTYEATAQKRGNWVTAELMAIEAFVSFAQYCQKMMLAQEVWNKQNAFKEAKFGLAVGMLVSLFVHTTVEWYGKRVQDFVKAYLFAPVQTHRDEL